ncbi:TetR/AcrR family transcriptional regulator [Actinoplanes sp. NPDC049668]|uniref:TetR/AcrR family transcriptional regulator n=1 Tax=unclassified Actinoplanes TaxID=2626549 RepID=UPI0033B92FCD
MSEIPLPPWRRAVAKRPRAAKAPLSQDQIVDAGLRIVMAEGIDAVSMRRVAAAFDTGASSLYAHVANKEELLQLMFDRICGEVHTPEPEPARWQEQIKEMARDSHAVMSRYNNLARAALATVPTGPNALRVSEAMLAIMLSAGMPPQVAAWSLDRLFLYIVADAYENSLHMENMRPGLETREYFEGFVTQLRDFYGDLPADRFPNIRAHATTLTSGDGDQRFEFGLDMLVDGLARYLP